MPISTEQIVGYLRRMVEDAMKAQDSTDDEQDSKDDLVPHDPHGAEALQYVPAPTAHVAIQYQVDNFHAVADFLLDNGIAFSVTGQKTLMVQALRPVVVDDGDYLVLNLGNMRLVVVTHAEFNEHFHYSLNNDYDKVPGEDDE